MASKILVADDEAAIRRLLRNTLERAGYAVVEAINGKEAPARAGADRPDAILLDPDLPDRDGLSLIPLPREGDDAVILVVSARDATEEKVAALTRKEHDVLAILARHIGRVVTHERIIAAAWAGEEDPCIECLRIVVRNLRQKLEPAGQVGSVIANELGVGYRLRSDG
ncbi:MULTISPECIES: response regulator transcription factor [unclassified Sphingomonas]|uniref:response regulator transcription factor n=1 Tax=unclassified Sphingomonas TaxID=196159 RepID=UPI00226A3A27|nr:MULTISPECIES: response regulator transcription factor [unclassified Sphingomonas]